MWINRATLIALFIFPLLFPGQTSFVNDEAMLLDKALRANADHTLADAGLTGSLGRKYGPLPVWVYQLCLLITRDPAAIMMVRIAIVTATLLIALVWLERTLGLPRVGLIAIAISPYVWLCARQLWDNSFNIPLSALCLASYASFLEKPNAAKIMLTIALCGAMLLVHLMAAPFVLAIAVHLMVTRPRAARQYWQTIALAVVLCLFAGIRYWPQLFTALGVANPASHEPDRWWFALLGPRVLSGAWIEYFFPPDWLRADGGWHVMFQLARAISLLAFPLALVGLMIGIKRSHPIALVCLLAILGQLILNVATRTHGHPHYYNGTFAAFAVLMWMGMDDVMKRWPRIARLAWLQPISAATICVLLLIRIMQTGGTRDARFGSTLANQARVVRELARYSDLSPVRIEANISPRSLLLLDELMNPPRPVDRPFESLAIRYKRDSNQIELVEVNPSQP